MVRRLWPTVIGTLVVLGAAAGMSLLTGAAELAVVNPPPSVLAATVNFQVHVLSPSRTEPVSLRAAEETVLEEAFQGLPAATPMAGELVSVSAPDGGPAALATTQVAWLITWAQPSQGFEPYVDGNGPTPPTYAYENCLVSATSGNTLAIFPTN